MSTVSKTTLPAQVTAGEAHQETILMVNALADRCVEIVSKYGVKMTHTQVDQMIRMLKTANKLLNTFL